MYSDYYAGIDQFIKDNPGVVQYVDTANSSQVDSAQAFNLTPLACLDLAAANAALYEKPQSCPTEASYQSTANMSSGNISHSQPLFATNGVALAAEIDLAYQSLNIQDGPLGKGWTHTYHTSLTLNNDGSVFYRGGEGAKRLYTLSRGSYVSPAGDYSALVKNADGSFTITYHDGLKQNFYSNGKLSSIVDRNNNTLTLAYRNGDPTGDLISVTDPAGRVTVLDYDQSANPHRLISVTDPAGNIYNFEYSGGMLSKVINPSAVPGGPRGYWQYTYNGDGLMITKTDPGNNITTYDYYADYRTKSAVDPEGTTNPAGHTRSQTYNDESGVVKTTTFTEKDGGQWLYSYDITTATLKSKTDPYGNTTSYTHDSNLNMLTKTEPVAGTMTYTHDAFGNVLTATDPLKQTTTYTYNHFGQMTSATDPLGRTTTNTYDDKGNLTQTIDPLGGKTVFTYDAKGNPLTVTNALSQTSSFTYDTASNLVSAKDPLGNTTIFTYDVMGNVLTRTDALGNVTRFQYDAMNRLTKITDALGGVNSYSYDANGNRITETDANGNTTTYQYNYRGQAVKSTDAMGNSTVFTYGATGCASCGGGVDKLTSVTDANGNVTTYQYDNLGRLLTETDPLGKITSYGYDAIGNLISKTDANGNTVKYTYDSLGRLLKKMYPDGKTETFSYDAVGNILTAGNPNISYTMTYDNGSRLTAVTDSFGWTMSYEYDLLGNRTKLMTPNGRIIKYFYDPSNRLTRLITAVSSFTFRYDNLGRLTFQNSVFNNISTYFDYDALGRVTGRSEVSYGFPFVYTYDKKGNMLSLELAAGGSRVSYCYDALDRLIGATSSDAGRNEAYSYDPLGNRLTGPDTTTKYTYGPANELITRSGTNYQYDANGNLVSKTDGTSRFTYEYDYENHLVKVTKADGSSATAITFKYDPLGRRIEKAVSSGNAIKVKRYLYDGENVLYECDINNSIIAGYLHNVGIDNPLAMMDNANGEYYLYHKDIFGSITGVTDYIMLNAVRKGYTYDSFGNIVSEKGSYLNFNQPYTYRGREWDPEIGLYYYRARYYDPTIGRFISRDPISFAGGDVNLYGYVQNNPVNKTDPLGLLVSPPSGHDVSDRFHNECSKCKTSVSSCMEKCVGVLNPWWTTPVSAGMGLGAYSSSGSIVAGAGVAGAIWGGWGLGTSAGCFIACANDPCSYD